MLGQIRWRIAFAYAGLTAFALGLLASLLIATGSVADPSFILKVLAVILVVVVLDVVVAHLLARRALAPLKHLTTTVRRLSEGGDHDELANERRDEVSQLADAIAAMAAQFREQVALAGEQSAEAAAILAEMGDGVVIVDEQRRVVAVNRAAERMLATTEAEAKGTSVTELVRRHEVVNLLDDGKHSAPIVAEIGPDRRQVQVLVTPISVGETNRQLILLQDVTELRRAETIRRDFVANVSHELRTPLAAMRAVVETLEDGALSDPIAGPEFLARMHVEVDRLNQMLEELLELARLESGRLVMSFKRSNVADVVCEAVDRMRPQAERQALTLTVIRPPEATEALVDAARLHQVLVNLIHNAIKFTPPGGTITVTVRRSDSVVEIGVADTGIGVRSEDLPRLFERFYKTDRSRSSPGTGLGLAIVKHIVQAHSGQVAVESPGPGLGTTFTVRLPSGRVPRSRLLEVTRGTPNR